MLNKYLGKNLFILEKKNENELSELEYLKKETNNYIKNLTNNNIKKTKEKLTIYQKVEIQKKSWIEI